MKLRRLAEIGRSLREALELGLSEPGSVGHRAAWARAEDAARAVGELVTMLDSLEPVVHEARRAVSGERVAVVRGKKLER